MSTITVTDDSDREILSSVKHLISDMSPKTKKLLKKRFESIAVRPCPPIEEQLLADEISGKSYTKEEVKELLLSNLINSFTIRNSLLKNSISGAEVATLLDCSSRQTPLDRVKNKTLLAVKDNGQWKYPLWQFDINGPDRVIEGLPLVLAALNVSNLAKISWLTRHNPVFEGKTPLEMLENREVEKVLTEARGVGIAQ
ncbi:antitoxin Xre/MbcA/ParS toxin-binding domain-containing protein [Myxosarcina sp. GI1]|uniref:antitoxin Xre/MbcA/ParS toxin-binding domain-containing protein n=1 Tax=Myxosarcina sp. GI1 TaxID=1541065 RepID=UPI0012E0BDF7|nr:antitoxin Xre/MbcA/ParS toxin-binding domain-containing protein [Myxosarcina sp. GI1]